MVIGINCGHTVSGQPGCGAVGYIDESVETRKVGNKLMILLSKLGHTVYDCTDDYADSESANLNKIVKLANSQPLDLFVSIHFNKFDSKAHGTEVYTYGGKQHTEAVNVCSELNKIGFTNRGIKSKGLYVINHTNAKSMLIEVCFVDNKSDVDLYNRVGANGIAAAIAKAITGQAIENEEELTMTQYEELKKEIQALKPMVYNYMDDNMPSWAKPTIQKLMDKGALVGDGEGKLGLTNDTLRVLVMLDRANAFDK